MSEKVVRIKINELKTARVTCKVCKRIVVEVPVGELSNVLAQGSCRFCYHRFQTGGAQDQLLTLQQAILDLQRDNVEMEVEFDIPAS